MATQTPLTHPEQNAQMAGLYRYLATFTKLDDNGAQQDAGMGDNIPCAYMPMAGAEVPGMVVEQSTKDQILIPQWLPGIETKWYVELKLLDGAAFGRFQIDDVMTNDSSQSATLLTVSAA